MTAAVAASYREYRADLVRRLQEVSPGQRLSELGSWSVYRCAGLHPRCFVGVDMAVAWSGWPECLRKAFLACWNPLQVSLEQAAGPFWRWPDKACQVQAERLADVVRTFPECLACLPLPIELFFARLFLLAGQLDLYWRHRASFVERAGLRDRETLERADETLPAMYRMTWANEQADPEQLVSLIEELGLSLAVQPEAHREFLHLSHLYRERCRDYELAMNTITTVNEAAFASSIRGRRIAIVGPADVGLESGPEINGFDLVIRPTHRAGNVLPQRQFGSRSDIAYYLEGDLSSSSPVQFLSAMRGLRFVVLADNCRQRFLWLNELGERLRTRFEIGIRRNPFLVGYPAAIPRILMDVLRFSPAEVKVFNANLYLTTKYAGNYLQDASFSFYPGFALHDPVSNFNFMQRAWRGGWYEADSVLASILSLSVQEYQDTFSRVHRGPGMDVR